MSDSAEMLHSALSTDGRAYTVAITGGQGVGKTTFSKALKFELEQLLNEEVGLLSGLGESARNEGYTVGSSAPENTVRRIFAAHLEREDQASHRLTILDRCLIDAIAYLDALNVTAPEVTESLRASALHGIRRINFLIVLEISPFFQNSGGSHETADFRTEIAERIDVLFADFDRPKRVIDASDDAAVRHIAKAIVADFHLSS